MYAVEFRATIKSDGTIDVPAEICEQLQGEQVRVLLLTAQQPQQPSFIQELLKNPRKVEGFTPLTREEIYDREK